MQYRQVLFEHINDVYPSAIELGELGLGGGLHMFALTGHDQQNKIYCRVEYVERGKWGL